MSSFNSNQDPGSHDAGAGDVGGGAGGGPAGSKSPPPARPRALSDESDGEIELAEVRENVVARLERRPSTFKDNSIHASASDLNKSMREGTEVAWTDAYAYAACAGMVGVL